MYPKKTFCLDEIHIISPRVVCSLVILRVNLKMNENDTPHLVGGLEHFLFFHILGIIIPTN